MKKKTIAVRAPNNLGLQSFVAGKEPGVKGFADAWFGLAASRGKSYDLLLEIPVPGYSTIVDPVTMVLNTPELIEFSQRLAELIVPDPASFYLVIGGDCSNLLGCMLGLKSSGEHGLFFLDGHTDFVMPEQSHTKAAAGMDLAMVTGHGPTLLTGMHNRGPYVSEANVFSVGNRYLEEGYVNSIKGSAIRYFDLAAARKTGMAAIAESFLKITDHNKLDGFWIHLDVDVLDDELMPCVDSRTPGGVSYGELVDVLLPLLRSDKCRGMDISIYDPELDPDGNYLKALFDNLSALLEGD